MTEKNKPGEFQKQVQYTEVKKLLKDLKSAPPEDVIRAFFWGHSNHSKEVINATVYHDYSKVNTNFPEIKQWDLIEITKLDSPPPWLSKPEGKFSRVAYFRVKHCLILNPGCDESNTYLTEISQRGKILWYFTLVKDKDSGWHIFGWGN